MSALDLKKSLKLRIVDLVDKEKWMRSPHNPDGRPAPILLGRVQGQIGELKRILEILEAQ